VEQNADYGKMDVNSQHQIWSRWTFVVVADKRKMPSMLECRENARKFFREGFGSIGRAKIDQYDQTYVFVVEVEGPPAHDPEYRKSVARQFKKNFINRGFGYSARLQDMEVRILSGDKQDGKPADQMIVLPSINLREQFPDVPLAKLADLFRKKG
jgi:hypothetical protein